MRTSRKQKLKLNPTVRAMRHGLMVYKRRLEIQMWHIEHLDLSINVLEELVEQLKGIRGLNSARNVDKLIHAQGVIVGANKHLAQAKPRDPRVRGAEMLVYDPHLIDLRGHDDLQGREDLNEPQQKPDGGYGL